MRLVALAAALTLIAGQAAAASVEGVWRTAPRDNGAYIDIEIRPCAGEPANLCGIVVAAYNGAHPDVVGKPIIHDMAPAGPNRWADGEIVRPRRGTKYSSKMALRGNVLQVSGCVVGGLICRSQDWIRVD